jgi:hypothetical protein
MRRFLPPLIATIFLTLGGAGSAIAAFGWSTSSPRLLSVGAAAALVGVVLGCYTLEGALRSAAGR